MQPQQIPDVLLSLLNVPDLVILAVVLVIFGPKNLPKLGGMLGRTVKKIRGRVEDDTQTA